MLVGSLTLVHSTVLQLKVGKADLSGRDSPSEGPTWKDTDYIRRWRKHHHCGMHNLCPFEKSKGKTHLQDQTRTSLSSHCFSHQPQGLKNVLQSTNFQQNSYTGSYSREQSLCSPVRVTCFRSQALKAASEHKLSQTTT